MTSRVCVGQILGPHGVHGRLKVKSFTADPEALFTYAPLTDEGGTRTFTLRQTGMGKDHFLVEAEGVRRREGAEALKGVRLYVDRAHLPDPEEEDEFYHADLVGLPTELPDGTPFGPVVALFDFGAGDLLEVAHPSGKTVHVPFTKACVPVVDVAGRRIVVTPPANLFDPAPPPPSDAEMETEIEVELEDDGGPATGAPAP